MRDLLMAIRGSPSPSGSYKYGASSHSEGCIAFVERHGVCH